MDEHVFLKEKGVTVTNARFITYGKTQVLAGITSVDCLVRTPSRFWPIILILIGLVLIFAVGSGLFMGLISNLLASNAKKRLHCTVGKCIWKSGCLGK